jgi:diguanylate cyclase (GGDEF)-like protein
VDDRCSLGIPAPLMGEVFPFHFAFDRDLRVVQTGQALHKLCPRATVGAGVQEFCQIITPAGVPLAFDAISEQRYTVFFLALQREDGMAVTLKGQMVHANHAGPDVLAFLASPVVPDIDRVAALGLTLNDFAVHDSAVDFLILLQTKNNTINDVKKMADRLRKEVTVRREAEQALKAANEGLEARVADRTQELSDANAELHTTVKKLETLSRQMALLNRMGDMLQACRSVGETYSVIIDTAQQLFPHDAGALALNAEDGTFGIVSTWGEAAGVGTHFELDDCWALRRSRLHVVEPGEGSALCGHLGTAPLGGYICAPLMVQGERLGVLHLQCDVRPRRRPQASDFLHAQERKQLVHTAAEHIALAVANLRLQESLRVQSIRDPLTGLYNRRHMEESLHREIDRARRRGLPVGIIMTDVDHFKRFNDSFGHQAGDALLRALGRFLGVHVRSEDIACRYGGEEFILILPGASMAIAEQRAERLRHDVEHELRVQYHGAELPPVTISLGVAVYPGCAGSADLVVKAADAALYAAKAAGRNRVMVAPTEVADPLSE